MPRKILVVEDDRDVQKAIRIWLSANGYTTVSAVDAVSAISVARNEKPDLIVLDVGLPAGDGFVVMERLQDIGDLASIPVIIVTARDPSVVLPQARRAGARGFLRKPVDGEDLLYSISRVLKPN